MTVAPTSLWQPTDSVVLRLATKIWLRLSAQWTRLDVYGDRHLGDITSEETVQIYCLAFLSLLSKKRVFTHDVCVTNFVNCTALDNSSRVSSNPFSLIRDQNRFDSCKVLNLRNNLRWTDALEEPNSGAELNSVEELELRRRAELGRRTALNSANQKAGVLKMHMITWNAYQLINLIFFPN